MQTVPTALTRAADRWPDAEALVDGALRLTWSELAERVQVMSRYLLAKGIGSGDRVAIHGSNRWQWVVTALGALSVGATLVPVNTRLAAPEVDDILARTRPALVVRELDWSEVTAVAVNVPEADARDAANAVRPEQVSDILFTSGTTGRSKGAMSAHAQALSVAAAWAERAGLTVTDRYLVINPFSHSFGYKAGILACLLTGATMIPMAVFRADEAMALIERERVTVLPGAPTLYRSLLDAPNRSGYDLSSLRIAVTGATTVPVALIEEMRAELTFDTVLTAYGLTEAVVATMCEPGDDAHTISHTCGHPAAGFELRVDKPDDTGSGEVLLRGPNVMLGYLDESSVSGTSISTESSVSGTSISIDPSATAAAVDADGWLHTGDIGRLDERGYLTITDRLKDMYICGGFNVYPAEVEQALARLAGVAEAAVIGVPDGRMGEVGRAYVVPRPGATLRTEDVVAHCKERLAGYKVPRQVEFRDELPRNASGKVLKTELRAEANR